MEIHADLEQGTEDWFRIRAGKPTTSQFSTVLAKGRGGGESKTRTTYMRKLAGEIITGEPMDNYSNAHMERGHEMEEEARSLYEMLGSVEVRQIGFVESAGKGCSPDGFVGQDGMLEIKSAMPHILIEKILSDGFPPEHKAQTQGALWVCERDWIDLIIYWPRMPVFQMRASRDDEYIQTLSAEVDRFNTELNELVETVRKYR